MKPSWVIFFALMCASVLTAGDTIPTVQLKNGRILHDVKVLKVHPLFINIFSAEGLLQIQKSDLPPEILKQYPIDLAAAKIEAEEHQKAAQSAAVVQQEMLQRAKATQKTRLADRELKTVRNHCRILSFSPIYGSILMIELRNETDVPLKVDPNSVLASSTEGKVYDGYWLIHSASGWRRSETAAHVPGNSTIKLPMMFSRAKDVVIADVYWAPDPNASQPTAIPVPNVPSRSP